MSINTILLQSSYDGGRYDTILAASIDGDQYDAVTTCSDSVCNCNLKFDEAKI